MIKIGKTLGNQGFTLVELVVTLLISSILLATIGSVFLFSQKIYTRSENISYKEGVVTNTETNLQNYLSTATDVELLDAPVMNKKSYNIGFNSAGVCEEVIVTSNSDGLSYVVNRQVLSHISEIYAKATGKQTAVLNYKLVPIDTTMTTLVGGIVMNNINTENKNMPEDKLKVGSNLNISGNSIHYLVLTFEGVSGGTEEPVEPDPDINEELKGKGIIAGNWDKMIANAKISVPYGYTFEPKGAVYYDSTGTYVTSKAQYISRSFAEGNPTAHVYYDSLGGEGNDYFLNISETTRQVTEDDYDTGLKAWKIDQYPKLGDLYLYNGNYYIWENKYSNKNSENVPTEGHGWLKLVSAPEEFK